ncbi:MAG: MFS transporter [Anaerolineae bacterium]
MRNDHAVSRGELVLPALCLSGGLAGLSVSITTPIIVDIARHCRISEAAAGQLMTVASIAGVIGTLAISPFLDRVGRRRGITAALLLMAVACLGCTLAPSFAVLSLAYCLVGLSGYTLFAQVLAAVGDLYSSDKLGRAMGWVTFGNVGFVVAAMPVIGWLAQRVGWQYAFLLLGLCALSVAIWDYSTIPTHLQSVAHERMGYAVAFAGLRRSRAAMAALAALGIVSASYYGFATYMAVVATDALGATTEQISLVISVRFIGAMVLGLAAGVMLRSASWWLAVLACLACAVFTLLVYLAPGSLPLLGLENFLYGFAVGMVDVGINAILAAADTGSRGLAMAMRSVMDSLGGIAGPALGGVIIAISSYTVAGWAFAALAFLAAVTVTGARRPVVQPVQEVVG